MSATPATPAKTKPSDRVVVTLEGAWIEPGFAPGFRLQVLAFDPPAKDFAEAARRLAEHEQAAAKEESRRRLRWCRPRRSLPKVS